MDFNLWFVLLGSLFILMVLASTVFQRLPLTTSMFYLAVGVLLGQVFGLIQVDPVEESALLERLAEIAVIVSLFTAGLKLRTPLADDRWQLPVRLAFLAMTLTVGLITGVGVWLLNLPLGAAVLLGAVLAPTDPVLASGVQVKSVQDQDRLRFSLTGEAGLNDGAAFPFVMLGLGLLGLHEIGAWGWRWWTVDVAWAITGGFLIGGLLGTLVGHLVLYLRQQHKEAVGRDDFLTLGLIGLSYGVALLAHTYGFLAVFAAGLTLRRVERQSHDGQPAPEVRVAAEEAEKEEIATDPEQAPAYMAQAVLGFNEQLERILEVAMVLLLGGLLSWSYLPNEALWFAPLLFFLIRPISVELSLLGSRISHVQRSSIAWFGIRGIGSIYYLMYAVEYGLPPALAERLTGIVLTVIALSIVAHGVSVTPLMGLYARWAQRHQEEV